jgi:hypothetical protein
MNKSRHLFDLFPDEEVGGGGMATFLSAIGPVQVAVGHRSRSSVTATPPDRIGLGMAAPSRPGYIHLHRRAVLRSIVGHDATVGPSRVGSLNRIFQFAATKRSGGGSRRRHDLSPLLLD